MTTWKDELTTETQKDYYIQLMNFVENEYATKVVYPERKNIYKALELCPLENVKVVIIGQDPYHEEGQAHGLSFSVSDNIAMPPSLKNIFKEISNEFNCELPKSGNLERWALQGVLLLNSILTVEAHKAASHANKGWEVFTDKIIEIVSQKTSHTVFMLWGNYAQKKSKYIDDSKHLILKAVHPSPLSVHRGFFGCNHFAIANKWLQDNQLSPIEW